MDEKDFEEKEQRPPKHWGSSRSADKIDPASADFFPAARHSLVESNRQIFTCPFFFVTTMNTRLRRSRRGEGVSSSRTYLGTRMLTASLSTRSYNNSLRIIGHSRFIFYGAPASSSVRASGMIFFLLHFIFLFFWQLSRIIFFTSEMRCLARFVVYYEQQVKSTTVRFHHAT